MARPKGGYYANGKRCVGVTTVSGSIGDKGGLMHAAVNLTIEGAGKGLTGGELKAYYQTEWNLKRDAGSLAHDMLETWARGEDVEKCVQLWEGYDETPAERRDELLSMASRAFNAFQTWHRTSALKVVAHEKPLVCADYMIGGTPDALGYFEDDIDLIDYKTGAFYGEHVAQMGAYRYLLKKVEGADVRGAHLLRLSRDWSNYDHHYLTADQLDVGWKAFLSALETYRYRRVLGKM